MTTAAVGPDNSSACVTFELSPKADAHATTAVPNAAPVTLDNVPGLLSDAGGVILGAFGDDMPTLLDAFRKLL